MSKDGVKALFNAGSSVRVAAEKIANELQKAALKDPGAEPVDEKAEFERIVKELSAPVIVIPTRRTKATVLVMLSHDYNHFEASIELSGGDISLLEIDNARKDCQRLADKAADQYKKAKQDAIKKTRTPFDLQRLRNEVAEIIKNPESQWDLIEKAKVKTLSDYDHQTRYDYVDDDQDYIFQ